MALLYSPENNSNIKKPEIISALASFVIKEFENAKSNRESVGVNRKLLASQKQYNGIYEDNIRSAISAMGGTDIYRKITTEKSNALISWLNEVILTNDDKFWGLKPTPIPELPEEEKNRIIAESTAAGISAINGGMPQDQATMLTKQTAQNLKEETMQRIKRESVKRASLMEREMADQLIEGNFQEALYDYFYNYAVYQTAFLKGPLVRIERQLKYDREGNIKVRNVPMLKWYAPSPFDMYPSPDAECVGEGRIFEAVRFTRDELNMLKSMPNYNKEALDKILISASMPAVSDDSYIRTAREELENKLGTNVMSRTYFEGVEMYGPVAGHLLETYGMDIEDLSASYECHVIMVNNEVILATLNEDVLKRRPYYQASFKRVPGSFWGISLPEVMEDIQRACNGAMRSLCDNLAISSGPMVGYDIAQLPPDTDITSVYPWKVFVFDGMKSFNTRKAIEFFQPNSNANELIYVYNSIKQEADNVTGIPSFALGDTKTQGGASTASGLSILQGNLTKGIKDHILNISNFVLQPALKFLFDWNMLYNNKQEIKGDSQIIVTGPLKVVTKEQKAMRLNEFLNITNNPTDLQIIGLDKRANMLREAAKTLDMNVNDVVPTAEEVLFKLQAQQIQQEQQIQGNANGQQ